MGELSGLGEQGSRGCSGNFVSRITKFCNAKFGAEVPAGGTYGPVEEQLIADIQGRLAAYEAHMSAMEIRKSAQELRAIWAAGNEYLQTVAPWSSIKTDPQAAAMQTRLGLNLALLFGVLSAPFLPDGSQSILSGMKVSAPAWPESIDAFLRTMPEGHAFTVPEVLYAKISDDQADTWRAAYAGK